MQVDPDRVDNVTIGFDEVPALKGRAFQGEWFSIGADRLPLFDHAIYSDENIGVEDTSENYPDGLVEGFHLVGLLDHLMNRVVRVRREEFWGWNYGLDRVRFVTPVTIHKPIRLQLTIDDVLRKDNGYVLVLGATLEIQEEERPGVVAVWRVFWLPR